MAIGWPIQIGSITCIVIYLMNYQLTKFESTIMNIFLFLTILAQNLTIFPQIIKVFTYSAW